MACNRFAPRRVGVALSRRSPRPMVLLMTDLLGQIGAVDLSSAVSVAVAKKALDAAKAQGAASVSLIRAAGKAGQTAFNGRPASPAGVGRHLDTRA